MSTSLEFSGTHYTGVSDVPMHSRVTLGSTGLLTASAATGSVSIGTVSRKGIAANIVGVDYWGPVRKMIASAAIAVGDRVGPAASGKIVTNASGRYIAIEAAGADGDVIRCVPTEPS